MQRIGVFVCHCGTNIAATVDVKRVVEAAASGLAPGEVRIRSGTGTAEIVLHNNGRVDINGLLFINGMPYLGMGG